MLLAVLVLTDNEFQIVGATCETQNQKMCVAGIEVRYTMIAEFSSAGSRLRASRGNAELHIWLLIPKSLYCTRR